MVETESDLPIGYTIIIGAYNTLVEDYAEIPYGANLHDYTKLSGVIISWDGGSIRQEGEVPNGATHQHLSYLEYGGNAVKVDFYRKNSDQQP
jgi:hypothetical protein